MKIGELARQADVSIDTIRFYERRGVLPQPERLASGYRTYAEPTVRRIVLARRLQALGFTLDEIVDALHATEDSSATCQSERWRLERVVERLDAQLAALQATRQHITSVMGDCDAGNCAFAPCG